MNRRDVYMSQRNPNSQYVPPTDLGKFPPNEYKKPEFAALPFANRQVPLAKMQPEYNYNSKNSPSPRNNYDTDKRLQTFKDAQIRKFADKQKEQQEIRQIYNIESSKKSENQRDFRENQIRMDMQMVNQAKIALERDRSMQALKKEQLIRMVEENNRISEAKRFQDPDFKSQLKNVENSRKPFEKSTSQGEVSKIKANDYQDKRYKEEDLRKQIFLIEEQRRRERLEKDLKSPGKPDLDFEKNQKKFFGIDEDFEDQELPSASEFTPVRFAKNNLKSMTHDPITGAITSYSVDRQKPRSLGAKAPEVFPGKIYDSPPQVEYELPKHTKKAPRNEIFNPLTGETQTIKVEKKRFGGALTTGYNPDENRGISNKIGNIRNPQEAPVVNPLPIFKGMGYKKSSIFS